jgi:hypothetical protein
MADRLMNAQDKLNELLCRLRDTRDEIENEIERLLEGKRRQFKYSLLRGKVVFDRNVKQLQQKQRISNLRYIFSAPVTTLLSAPVIYGMIVPLALLDLSITIYQHICFRVYKIPRVRRREFIVLDRHRLPYLNAIQKVNCLYCGYGNGLLAYAREIIARTEQYWCPIKHAIRAKGVHEREQRFFDYGDSEAWRNELQIIRCDWEEPDSDTISTQPDQGKQDT